MKNKKLIIGIAAVAAIALLLAGLYLIFSPKPTEGAKEITVAVMVDGETKGTHQLQTDAEYLGDVLEQEKIIEGEDGQYGLFIHTVDGIKADEGKQEWWCLTKGGNNVDTGVDLTPIQDGDSFELTLKVGY